jgi:cyclopropane fatty-acyl-phospholipid synthase-like methyltransferase
MYNANYYKKHETGSYQSAIQILEYINSFIDFNSVIDFGCGMGTWCKALNNLGVKNFLGIDKHQYDPAYMLIPADKYIQFDLRKSLEPFRRVDMAISVEVAEHVNSEYSDIFIKNLCSCSEIVLFSAAISYQGGTGHINEQSCTYWEKIFNRYGYKAIDCIRPYFWNNKQVEIWYKNNCILYIAQNTYENIFAQIPQNTYPLDIIHPLMLNRILKKKGVL